MDDPLEHYLTTHLTGASGAISLLEDLADRLDAPDLAAVHREVEEDARTAEALMHAIGMSPSTTTRLLATAGEMASRVARTGVEVLHPDLRTVGELEAVLTGIHGKMALWRLLGDLGHRHQALAALPVEALLDRAEAQAAVVERHRREAGMRAFAGG